jgi:hypothetical protein
VGAGACHKRQVMASTAQMEREVAATADHIRWPEPWEETLKSTDRSLIIVQNCPYADNEFLWKVIQSHN